MSSRKSKDYPELCCRLTINKYQQLSVGSATSRPNYVVAVVNRHIVADFSVG